MFILERFLRNVNSHFGIIIILLFSLLVLYPVVENGWVFWDDPTYVLENEQLEIESWSQVAEQFNFVVVQGNYHPITMLSYVIDYSIDGLNPKVFHSTNLIIHLLNTLLVYILIYRLFHDKKIGFLVSILFSIHPMHLESFAWVSERKDVLYVFFFLLGLIQYLNYTRSGNFRSYFLSILLYLMALLSKGMAVVFPVVLLLIDYLQHRTMNKKALLEKLPFFILSIIFGLIVIWAQSKGDAITSNADSPFIQTFLVPIYGLFMYLLKGIIPYNLSALHPYPSIEGGVPFLIKFSIVPLLLFVGIIVKFFRSNRPVVFGLLFFLVVIFPVLQFLSVGSAIISERYTYLAYLGLFVFMGVLLSRVYQISSKVVKVGVVSAVVIYLGSLSFQTYSRTKVWSNDETLWSDVINTYPDDYFAYMKRGSFRAKNGNYSSAMKDLNKSIKLFQHDYYAFNNRGMIYLAEQKYDLAEKDFSKAIALDSNLYEAYLNRGLIFLNTRKYELALQDFQKSTFLAPDNELNYLNSALLYERMYRIDDALVAFQKAVKINSVNSQTYFYRGQLLYKIKEYAEALKDFDRSLQLSKSDAKTCYWKAKTLLELNRKQEAMVVLKEAVNLGYPLSEQEYLFFK